MSIVTIECPATGKLIDAGMEINQIGFYSLPNVLRRVRCPLCGRDHHWWKRDARLTDIVSPANHEPMRKPSTPSARSSRDIRRPSTTAEAPLAKTSCYRFFLFDDAGHTVRLRLAECAEAGGLGDMARGILENEEPDVCAIEAWDTTQRLCRVERPPYPVAKHLIGSR